MATNQLRRRGDRMTEEKSNYAYLDHENAVFEKSSITNTYGLSMNLSSAPWKYLTKDEAAECLRPIPLDESDIINMRISIKNLGQTLVSGVSKFKQKNMNELLLYNEVISIRQEVAELKEMIRELKETR
jgi:hypothetical protein